MPRPKVLDVKPLPDYKLVSDFHKGQIKVFDVMPYIKGSWYEKLKVPAVFQTVHVSGSTVVWADGQDIAPHELYDDSVPAV